MKSPSCKSLCRASVPRVTEVDARQGPGFNELLLLLKLVLFISPTHQHAGVSTLLVSRVQTPSGASAKSKPCSWVPTEIACQMHHRDARLARNCLAHREFVRAKRYCNFVPSLLRFRHGLRAAVTCITGPRVPSLCDAADPFTENS